MSQSAIPASSPSARQLAAEHDIDLDRLVGTGPGGRIARADVEAQIASRGECRQQERFEAQEPTAVSATASASASPLARRLAEEKGIDIARIKGSGPGGKIVKSDIENFDPATVGGLIARFEQPAPPAHASDVTVQAGDFDAPFVAEKLNNVRKVIARRLTEAKQTIPHIYLTVDVRLDALLELRVQLNVALAAEGVKLSVNDFLIKALARALQQTPSCNASFMGDQLHRYSRQDISVAVAAPTGLITPIIRDAGAKGIAQISKEMKELAAKARDGKLQSHEFQGGTASLSNLGMFGIKQFDAVINPPQSMILAVGAGELRPWVSDGTLGIARVMTVTGSFDHRAIDGADGARLLEAFKALCEHPLGLIA